MSPSKTLGEDALKYLILALVLATAAGGGYYALNREGSSGPALRLRVAKLERGEVVEGIQASGAIQPLVLVQVGTQVSGTVEMLYKDFNSKVAADETIAILDSRRLVAQVAQDQANLGRARADVERVRAQLRQAEKNLERQRQLAKNEITSVLDLDAAEANAEALKAQVDVAIAVVAQGQAQLDGDLVNLRYATVKSPVAGVVVSRNVDVGQTVAASLSAPTLYVIANDLSKIQVQASVPEADIGKIKDKQRARFGVDAHPERQFEGLVSQVRLASTTVQNVVTYTVLVDADNPGEVLLPGMTANVTFEIARSPKDALLVASSALRFQPPQEMLEEEPKKDEPKKDGDEKKDADEPKKEWKRGGDKPGGERRGGGRKNVGTIYVKQANGKLKAIRVRTGVTDGVKTAIEPLGQATLEEGAEIATGTIREDEAQTTNPFAPRFGGGGGGRGR
jgi:HlyD family secretion protein